MPDSNICVLLVEDNIGDARLIQIMLTEASSQKAHLSSFCYSHTDRLETAQNIPG